MQENVLKILPELRIALNKNNPVVLTAPTGSGKTTILPPELLNESWLKNLKIIILEPRRLAAKRAANFIAKKRNEHVGETIGYQVRLERAISNSTKIEFITEGLLTQRILSDPELSDVGLIIFDEFHERSLALDTALALTAEIRKELRHDLRLIVMSATLQTKEILAYLGENSQLIVSPARIFPIETKLLGEIPVTTAIMKAVNEETGSILVFLPGEFEIRRTAENLTKLLPENIKTFRLFAAASPTEQDAAVATPKPGERKIVLATSIAESSVTIEGIRVVVDCGWARMPRFSVRNGLTKLMTLRISKDRAEQRKGRAGRIEAGTCYRLWTAAIDATLPVIATPEILESDLTQTVLILTEWGNQNVKWLTPPPIGAWQRAVKNLQNLNALDSDGNLTELGRTLVNYPLHPALASLILKMKNIDPAGGAFLVAVISELETLKSCRGITDFRKILSTVLENPPDAICKLAARWNGKKFFERPKLPADLLAKYVILAFPEHVARQRKGTETYLTAAGFGATLPKNDPMNHSQWLLIVQMSDAETDAKIRSAVPLNESDVATLKTETVDFIAWNRITETIEAVQRTQLGAIVLKEIPLKTAEISAEYENAVSDAVKRIGFTWQKKAGQLRDRINFAYKFATENKFPDASDCELKNNLEWLKPQLNKIRKKADIENLDLYAGLIKLLNDAGLTLHQLDKICPPIFIAPTGSNLTIHYDENKPFVEVKLQEIFGIQKTPTICNGKCRIVLHLLSPAQRPVQITEDLESFWATGYSQVRKDLRGRYPKHYWPENPYVATPTRKTKPQISQP